MFYRLFNREIVFKISDYDLDLNERKVKFKGCNLILYEKCQQQFDHDLFYCEFCYSHCSHDKEERNRIKYGKCKGCFQTCTEDNWCSSCGF